MLFIDEPPFLDEEGVQAYCDALEAIQSRYENMKVMAITHNQAMKERFPQSIEVIKTEEGSKVQFLN
jgi:exonuclease SbcC